MRGVDVEKYAYYVNKLRQNVGLETLTWRQIVTSQTAHTKYKWPPYATEWNRRHENFLRTPLFQTNVLTKFVEIICIFFYTHSPYFMCYFTKYNLSTLQVAYRM